jgi:two-component system LytT family response regulator
MTLRSLIVDDEPLARKRLRSLLRSEPRVEVVGEAEDGPAALEAIRRLEPDLVWLDVQMPGLDGFGVLDEIGPGAAPAIIFVTAHDRYALRAFDAHAVDYLLKPFDRARLREAIDRAIKLAGSDDLQRRLAALLADITRQRPLRRIVVRSGGRIYFVGVSEVDWIERGVIVNADRIQEIHPAFHGDLDVVLKNGTRLRASRNYAARLREWLDR